MKVYLVAPVDIKYSYKGTEWHVYEYAKYLLEKGMDASLIITRLEKRDRQIRDYRILSKRYLKVPKEYAKPLDISTFHKAHILTYPQLPRDGVVYIPYSIHASLFNILMKPRGQKYIIGCHSMQLKFGRMIHGKHQLYEGLLSLIVKVFLLARKGELKNIYFHVLNSTQADYLIGLGINRQNIFNIPAMLETRQFRIGSNRSRKLNVVYIGGPGKELDVIIETAALLKTAKLSHNFEFYLIGEINKEFLERASAVRNVHYLGHLSNEEKLKRLSMMDVMMIPAYEIFPKTMLEGLASGLYILTSKKNISWHDIVGHGIRMTVTEHGTPNEYVKHLEELARRKGAGKEINPYKTRNRSLTINIYDDKVVLKEILSMFRAME